MEIIFEKYQGTGNDFVMIDQRHKSIIHHDDQQTIAHLCDRRFGIGGDGLILLEKSDNYDFKMVYFNADGRQSTMCGNGGRCIVKFAHQLKIFDHKTVFEAIDGEHHAYINEDGSVSLQMIDVQDIISLNSHTFQLNTGSPHYVDFGETLPDDIKSAGSHIRYSPKYKEEGINVNFVAIHDSDLEIATYERGVEDETYSCGTGVTAAALAYAVKEHLLGKQQFTLQTKGGNLNVSFMRHSDGSCTDVWLSGPALRVFNGDFKISNSL